MIIGYFRYKLHWHLWLVTAIPTAVEDVKVLKLNLFNNLELLRVMHAIMSEQT
jgi:hypothetical protein